MVKVTCLRNIGFEGTIYRKGETADLPEETVVSLGHFVEVLPPEPEPEKPKRVKAAEKPEPADPVYLRPLQKTAETPE